MQVPVSCHCLVSLFVFVAPSAFVMDMQTGRQINRRLSLPVSCVTCTFRRALPVVSRACFVSCGSRGSMTRHAPLFGNMPSTPEMKIRMRKSSHLKRERGILNISRMTGVPKHVLHFLSSVSEAGCYKFLSV